MKDRRHKNIIVGLDVGTTKVCTIVGIQHSSSDIEIIGIGNHPSYGLQKGYVVNIDKTIKSIQCSLEDAKLMAGVDIENVTIGVAGSHIYSFNSSGVVAVKGSEITQDDVARVLEAAEAVVIPPDREILHIIPQEYRIDNIAGIHDPVGMCGSRLEAHVHVVTGSVSLIQNLIKCVEQTGIYASNIMLQPVASSESVLDGEEKNGGVVLVDIGGGTTDIAVWKGGNLVHSQIIPVGGNHFTNDLATGLKISPAEAERVKIHHGSVLAEKLNQSAHITVQERSKETMKEIQLSNVANILGARAEELFGIIENILNSCGFEKEVIGGIVLTGGGALIKDMDELGEYILNCPTRIGHPRRPLGGMTNVMQNPRFSTVLGLLLESEKQTRKAKNKDSREGNWDIIMGKLSDSLKGVFKEIF